jgi:mRNA-degrading endonuclease toxin of MazEF toxin-antitoxin module
MNPGDIYWSNLPAGPRPAIVVSREILNRGDYVVVVLCTTTRFEERSVLPNCVPFSAGEFGFTKNCVAQCEAIAIVDQMDLDTAKGPIGMLDAERLRTLIRAIGYVIEAECEPE